MSEYQIFHNPRCSKSRQALTLLQDNGIEPNIILYLEEPPSVKTLTSVIGQLGISPRELLRKGEAEFKELGLSDPSLKDQALIKAMSEHPKLIERPIVLVNGRAVIGRPPEAVLSLI